MTVRRGSPAARSGLIRPGDRLESVEGRSVVNLPHRELAQILRRAGNTLRLTIVPRSSARELHIHFLNFALYNDLFLFYFILYVEMGSGLFLMFMYLSQNYSFMSFFFFLESCNMNCSGSYLWTL